LAEVDEIHVPKTETVGQAVTLRYLRSKLNRSGLSVSRPGTNYSKGGGAAAAAATAATAAAAAAAAARELCRQ